MKWMYLCGLGNGAHGGLSHRGFLSGESEHVDDSDGER